MRKVVISFIIETNKVDMKELAERIDIIPYSIKSTFREGSIAKPYWYTEVQSRSSTVEKPLKRLLDRVLPKAKAINEICSQFSIHPCILINIRADYVDRPVVEISKEFLSMILELNAELLFDIITE